MRFRKKAEIQSRTSIEAPRAGRRRKVGRGELRLHVWDLFLHHVLCPCPDHGGNTADGSRSLQKELGTQRQGDECRPSHSGEREWGAPSLCPQQHRKAAGEKKQQCGGSRHRRELGQWPQGQQGCTRHQGERSKVQSWTLVGMQDTWEHQGSIPV